jgi:ABC-2 type transport system permease protein
MRGMSRLSIVEMKLFLREPFLGFFTLIFPLLMLFSFGTVYGNEPNEYFGGHGMVDISVPAYTAIVIAMTAFLSLAIGMATYRERGVLRRLQVTPLRPYAVLVSQVFVLLLMTAASMALLVACARLVYGMRFQGNVISVAGAFVLSCFSFFSLGFVLAGLAPSTRTAQIIGMVAFYPMIFLSGATMPLESMSEGLRHYAKILPLTHVVTLLRGLWVGEAWGQHMTEVAVLGAILVVGLVISAFTFRWE